MSQYQRDCDELGGRVARHLLFENSYSLNLRAQHVACGAAGAQYLAELERIYETDFGFGD